MKYKLTDEIEDNLYRIEALKDFGNVKKGDKGGWIEKETNLSQDGNCWIYNNAEVYGDATVTENALVFESARVSGKAVVCGKAKVFGDSWIFGNARVSGTAKIFGEVEVFGCAQISKGKYDYGYIFTIKDDDWL